jgi:hypothetical protein
MIQVHIADFGVERVLFISHSDSEEDRDLLCWRKIRELIDQIDKELREKGGNA